MNKKDKSLSLRIINEMIKNYAKFNFSDTSDAVSLLAPQSAILTPCWLVSIKREIIYGKYLRLPDVVAKVKATLEDSLKGLGSLLAVFCQVLIKEQILNEEIQRLPRGLKSECKNLDQPHENKKGSKSGKKRRATKKQFALQSNLLTRLINDYDLFTKRNDDSVVMCLNTSNEQQPQQIPMQEAVIEPQEPKKRRQSRAKSPQQSNAVTTPKRRGRPPKNANPQHVVDEQQNEKQMKSKAVKTPARMKKTNEESIVSPPPIPGTRRSTRLSVMLNNTSTTNQLVPLNQLEPPTRKRKQKEKLPEETSDIVNESEKVVKRRKEVENLTDDQEVGKTPEPSSGSDFTSKKRKKGFAEFTHHLQNLIKGQKESRKDLPHIIEEISHDIQKLIPGNPEECSDALEQAVVTSTPIKVDVSTEVKTAEKKVPSDVVTTGENVKIHVDNTEIIAEIAEVQTIEPVEVITIQEEHSEKVPTPTVMPAPQTNEPLPPKIRRKKSIEQDTIPKKKRPSKFLQKGNQLMGIEENTLALSEGVSIPSTPMNEVPAEPSDSSQKERQPEKKKKVSFALSSGKKNANKSTVEPKKHASISTHKDIPSKDDAEEPEVLKVLKKSKCGGVKRKIIGLLTNKKEKSPDLTVEIVPVDDKIDDHMNKDRKKEPQEIDLTSSVKKSRPSAKSAKLNPKTSVSNMEDKIKSREVYRKRCSENVDNNAESPTENATVSDDSIMKCSIPDKSIDTLAKEKAKLWADIELTQHEKSLKELWRMPEVPEISCFLHVCQKALQLPFFTHFEFERSLLIPHASHLMAAVVTALLRGVPSRKDAQPCLPMSYLEWNKKLTARLAHWFLIFKTKNCPHEVNNLIGMDPDFWTVLGNQRNPLFLKPYHRLPINERVVILKGLCDHLFHVSKRIQTALISTRQGGREGDRLGRNNDGEQIFYFPVFLRNGVGDLRIYREANVNKAEESKTANESEIGHTKPNSTRMSVDGNEADSGNNSAKQSMEESTQSSFSLVADNFKDFNTLVMKYCENFSENMLAEAEKSHSQNNQQCVTVIDVEDIDQANNGQADKTSSPNENMQRENPPTNDDLLLAIKMRSLFRELKPMENLLDKSQTAALVKLHLEWLEFKKDESCVPEKNDGEVVKKPRRPPRVKSNLEPKDGDDIDDPLNSSNEEPNSEEQSVPSRKLLSRRAKINAGMLIKQENKAWRKEIVAKLEEDALMERSNLTEETPKWEPSLWADEDSSDDENGTATVEDTVWYGYAAIQKEAIQADKQSENVMNQNWGNSQTKKNTKRVKEKTTDHVSKRENLATIKAKTAKKVTDLNEIEILKEKCIQLSTYKINIEEPEIHQVINLDENEKQSGEQNESKGGNSSQNNQQISTQPGSSVNVIEVQEIKAPHHMSDQVVQSITNFRTSKVKSITFPPLNKKGGPVKIYRTVLPHKKPGQSKDYTLEDMKKYTDILHKAAKDREASSNNSTSEKDSSNPLGVESGKTVSPDIIEIKAEPEPEVSTNEKELSIEKDASVIIEQHTIKQEDDSVTVIGEKLNIKEENSITEVTSGNKPRQVCQFQPFKLKSTTIKEEKI